MAAFRAGGLLAAVLAAALAACAGALSPSPASSPEANNPMPSQEPSHAPPTATPDPDRFGPPPVPPEVSVASTETADGVSVVDLTFSGSGVEPVEAYLVLPEVVGEPGPGILWFHWLETGAPTSNRTEFLEEARALAQRGAVSLLVQGTLPWRERPTSIEHDVVAIEAEVHMLRAALELLAARPEVDAQRLAAVGHDFGGMYETILFGLDPRLDALALMAPTARWGDWFLRYWPISDPDDAYVAAMAPLDPVTWLPAAAGRPVLLQFAAGDQYVPEEVAAEITAVAGSSAQSAIYDAGHELNEEARTDRDAWLVVQLGLEES